MSLLTLWVPTAIWLMADSVPGMGIVLRVIAVVAFVFGTARLAPVQAIAVLEGLGGMGALKRSFRLTDNGDVVRFWVVSILAFPVIFVPPVLLYFDQRVRKEAYDIATLGEDLGQ